VRETSDRFRRLAFLVVVFFNAILGFVRGEVVEVSECLACCILSG